MKFLGSLYLAAGLALVRDAAANCGEDNCGRALRASSSAASVFCSKYLTSHGVPLPTFIGNCDGVAQCISSACSCLLQTPGPTTTTTKTTTTTTTTKTTTTGKSSTMTTTTGKASTTPTTTAACSPVVETSTVTTVSTIISVSLTTTTETDTSTTTTTETDTSVSTYTTTETDTSVTVTTTTWTTTETDTSVTVTTTTYTFTELDTTTVTASTTTTSPKPAPTRQSMNLYIVDSDDDYYPVIVEDNSLFVQQGGTSSVFTIDVTTGKIWANFNTNLIAYIVYSGPNQEVNILFGSSNFIAANGFSPLVCALASSPGVAGGSLACIAVAPDGTVFNNFGICLSSAQSGSLTAVNFAAGNNVGDCNDFVGMTADLIGKLF